MSRGEAKLIEVELVDPNAQGVRPRRRSRVFYCDCGAVATTHWFHAPVCQKCFDTDKRRASEGKAEKLRYIRGVSMSTRTRSRRAHEFVIEELPMPQLPAVCQT